MHRVDSIIYMSVCLLYPYLIIPALIIPINPSCVLRIFKNVVDLFFQMSLESFPKFHKNTLGILIGITQNLSINLKGIYMFNYLVFFSRKYSSVTFCVQHFVFSACMEVEICQFMITLILRCFNGDMNIFPPATTILCF